MKLLACHAYKNMKTMKTRPESLRWLISHGFVPTSNASLLFFVFLRSSIYCLLYFVSEVLSSFMQVVFATQQSLQNSSTYVTQIMVEFESWWQQTMHLCWYIRHYEFKSDYVKFIKYYFRCFSLDLKFIK